MSRNNYLSLDYLNQTKISLSTAILIFYLGIVSNFCVNLISGQLKQHIYENRYIQHLIGFSLIFVTISLGSGMTDLEPVFLYSSIGYLWFLLTTKLDLEWNLIVLLILLIGFIYENRLASHESKINEDNNLTKEEKVEIIIKKNKYKTTVIIVAIFVTLIGTIIYFNKKREQYGEDFNVFKFLLQAPKIKQ